jgi:hypothetical protein
MRHISNRPIVCYSQVQCRIHQLLIPTTSNTFLTHMQVTTNITISIQCAKNRLQTL